MNLSERRKGRDPYISLKKEIEAFGNVIWKGEPLSVVRSTLMPPQQPANIIFHISPGCFPQNGVISQEAFSLLAKPHTRSRWAHVALGTSREIVEQTASLLINHTLPPQGIDVKLRMVNHGSRPVRLEQGDKPFHFYVAPEKARIVGEELESIIGPEDGKPIQPFGEEGEDWIRYYEELPHGERKLAGLYRRIDQDERYWIPGSQEPITLPNFPTFSEIRTWLYKHYFKRIDDREYPMPRNRLWIGKLTKMKIGNGIYAELDDNAFVYMGNGTFLRKGLQIASPLLEGRTDEHNVEVKGPANLVLVRFLRNGQEIKAG